MTDRLVHLAATSRYLPMTEPHSLHTAEVRAMQRGLRGLAARGITARPTALRPAYFTTGGAANPRLMLTRDRA